MSPVVVVRPKRTEKEVDLLIPVGRQNSTASGTMISACHVATNMHVLFTPHDELSFGREMERRAEVLGTNDKNELVLARGRIIMKSNYWIGSDKEEAKRQELTWRSFSRDHEDLAIIRLEPYLHKGEDSVYRNRYLGDDTGWFVPAAAAPEQSKVYVNIGANTAIFVAVGQPLSTAFRYNVFYDKECRARHIDKYGYVTFKGNCHVISGMSGGAILGKQDRILYGLVQGGSLWVDGAPKKQLTDDFFDDTKFMKLPLNNILAIWPHRERIAKAMLDHPCKR